MCKNPRLLFPKDMSEEEGERYLMLEEHNQANSGVDNACLTLPDNNIAISVCMPSGCYPRTGPRIVELHDRKTTEARIEELCEENLEKTACLNGELDPQPQSVNHSGSAMTNGYLQTGNVQYQSMGYQSTAAQLPVYNQAGIQQLQHQTEGNQDVQSLVQDGLAHLPNEGSPESATSTLSPCPNTDQHSYTPVDNGFDMGAGAAIREGCHSNQSYSEDGGYESATSPYSSSYMSPPLVSPGCSETRSECGSVRPDIVNGQTGSYGLGYCDASPVCGSNAMLQGGNTHMLNAGSTAELHDTDSIFEALLETFDGQISGNQIDMTMTNICSTIDNITSQNTPSVSTHVKSPGLGIQKTRPSTTASTSIKKIKDKSLLRSFLTMPEDDIPKHSLTFIKKAKSDNGGPQTEDWQVKCGSAHGKGQSVGKLCKTSSGATNSVDKTSSADINDTLDLQEMPSDITDFALQYLDSLTEAQTQAVIADLSNEVAMDTTDSNFKKEIYNTITCQQSTTNNFHNTSKESTLYPPSYSSVNSRPTQVNCCTSVSDINNPGLCRNSSSHDHLYHQSHNKCSTSGNSRQSVRSQAQAHGCQCSQFTQTQMYMSNNVNHSDYRISELEKHLRSSCESYQQGRPCQGAQEFGSSSRPFLRQLLTGELTKDKYIQMERERCGYGHGIRPH